MRDRLSGIHRLIVEGKGVEARDTLRELASYGVARADAGDVAQLAWRVDLPELGLRVLHPCVRPGGRAARGASPGEQVEYAHCLVKCGAVDEGERMLHGIDPAGEPRALLYRVSALVSRWDYAGTIPLLENYLASTGADPYQQVVARANLAAAFVYERQWKKSTPLLRELLYHCSVRGYVLLLGRCLELSAETFFLRRKWDEARVFLAEAQKRLETAATLDALFVRKFQVLTELWRDGPTRESLDALQRLRSEAMRRRHWETVRDCDRNEALVKRDPRLLRHVYFGTPYPLYRTRLLADFGPVDPDWLLGYEWRLGEGEPPAALDLATGKLGKEPTPLKPGSVLHRLLVALSEDFYRPARVGALFALLHPDRHFDPESSPGVVHNALHRLRAWCEEAKLPLRIVEERGFFSLHAESAFALHVARGETVKKRHGASLEQLRALWPNEAFSIAQAEARTGLSRRTLFRVLEEARQDGMLERTGSSRATRYAFRRGAGSRRAG